MKRGDKLIPIQSDLSFQESTTIIEVPHIETHIFGCILILCCATLGAGILATPHVFYLTGVLVGFLCLFFFLVCNVYSIWMMIKVGGWTGARDYEDMCEQSLGFGGKVGATTCLQISIFLTLTSYLVIVKSNIEAIQETLNASPDQWWIKSHIIFLAVVIIVMFPLCMLPNISRLEKPAFSSVFIIASVAIVTLVEGFNKIVQHRIDWGEIEWTKPQSVTGVLEAAQLTAFAYSCQPNIFPVWKELHKPSQKRMNTVQAMQGLFAFTLYGMVGFFGYIQWPINTKANLLELFPQNTYFLVIRIAFTIAIVLHFPVYHFAFRTSLESFYFRRFEFNWIRHTAETVLGLGAATVLAIYLPSLGTVLDFASILSYAIAFTLPGLAFVKCAYDRRNKATDGVQTRLLAPHTQPPTWRFFMKPHVMLGTLLVILSFVGGVLSLWIAIKNVMENKH